MSPLIDVNIEEHDFEAASPVRVKVNKKSSIIRTWGPALVAILGVIAVNVALMGPTGSKIPALTERHLLKQKLSEERTSAVLSIEFDEAADRKRFNRSLRSIGSRNLSEEEGGVLEYTRRRHRYLGEYVHVDVSGEFTAFGKWTTTIIYFACEFVISSSL